MTSSLHEPALDDDTTARLFRQLIERVRAQWVLVVMPVFAVVSVVVLVAGSPEVGVLLLGASLVGLWQAVTTGVFGASRWPGPARRLLAAAPWRPVEVTVLDVRGTVLRLVDGTHVRVSGLPAPVREVVVRAGQVGLIGPDATGWAAVRVADTHTPWPARVVTSTAAAATPSTAELTEVWVGRLVRRATVSLAATAAGTVALAVLVWLTGYEWWGVPAVVVAGAGCAVHGWVRLRAARGLRHRGPWQKAYATVHDWESRRDGVGDGRLELRFADGRRAVAELTGAPLDLFAIAWRREELWVADGAVAGFPDVAVVARARFSAPPE